MEYADCADAVVVLSRCTRCADFRARHVYDGERAMSARTRLDSTRETWRSRDEEKCLESVRTRVVLVDFGLEHEVVK